MNKIRSWLYIGKYKDTRNFYLLSRFNITSMLLLAELVEHPGITSRYFAVDDGVPLPTNLLQEGIQFVTDEKKRDHTILVACGAGISRSATFATAILKEVEQVSLLDAFKISRSQTLFGNACPDARQSATPQYHQTRLISTNPFCPL